jgi:hypothetical protein
MKGRKIKKMENVCGNALKADKKKREMEKTKKRGKISN